MQRRDRRVVIHEEFFAGSDSHVRLSAQDFDVCICLKAEGGFLSGGIEKMECVPKKFNTRDESKFPLVVMINTFLGPEPEH